MCEPNKKSQINLRRGCVALPLAYVTLRHIISSKICPYRVGDLDPHLIHGSLGPLDSLFQTASRSNQPFFQNLWSLPSNRLIERTQNSTGKKRPLRRTDAATGVVQCQDCKNSMKAIKLIELRVALVAKWRYVALSACL